MKSLITEIHPWEMSSFERMKIRTCPEKAYREGRPMAFSFTYPNVEPQVEEIDNTNRKKVILDEREGLIERLDRVFIDKSGRQLLREQY